MTVMTVSIGRSCYGRNEQRTKQNKTKTKTKTKNKTKQKQNKKQTKTKHLDELAINKVAFGIRKSDNDYYRYGRSGY